MCLFRGFAASGGASATGGIPSAGQEARWLARIRQMGGMARGSVGMFGGYGHYD